MFTEMIYLVFAAVLWQNIVLSGLIGLTPFLRDRAASLWYAGVVGDTTTVLVTLSVGVTAILHSAVLEPSEAAAAKYLVFAGVLLASGAAGMTAIRSLLTGKRGKSGVWAERVADLPLQFGEAMLSAGLIGAGLLYLMPWEGVGGAFGYAFVTGLGFTIVLLITEGIRERLEFLAPVRWIRGVPIQLVTLGILALIFSGFAGI